jgi:hypothetical protein
MLRGFALVLLLSCFACGRPAEPDRQELERLYARMIVLNEPGREPAEEDLDSFRAEIERLGGPARVESLMVRSIQKEGERWRTFLDSMAGREW